MDARHYAPRAPMHLAPTREAAVALARTLAARGGRPVGLVVRENGLPREDLGPGDASAAGTEPRFLLRVLSSEAPDYARDLYGTLHDLDDRGVAAVVVQAVPSDDPGWWAVADRLARGSTGPR